MTYTIARYGTRFWCVLTPAGELLGVLLYKRGATAVADLLNHLAAAAAATKE